MKKRRLPAHNVVTGGLFHVRCQVTGACLSSGDAAVQKTVSATGYFYSRGRQSVKKQIHIFIMSGKDR